MKRRKELVSTRNWRPGLWLVLLFLVSPAVGLDLSLTGSSTVAPLALEIGKKFEQQQDNVRVNVQTGGSTRGILDTRRALTDIGMVSRALKSTESDLSAFTIALDGICFIVHSSNPVSALTRQQIIDIYTGRITRWSEVGGDDKPITVVHKAEGRSTLELFLKHFELKNSKVKPHVVIGDNQQGMKTVAGNRHAIGYTSVGATEFEQSLGVPLKSLPLDGVAATTENIKNGTYALARPLNFVTKDLDTPLVKAFLTFAQSKQVRSLIESQYLVVPHAVQP